VAGAADEARAGGVAVAGVGVRIEAAVLGLGYELSGLEHGRNRGHVFGARFAVHDQVVLGQRRLPRPKHHRAVRHAVRLLDNFDVVQRLGVERRVDIDHVIATQRLPAAGDGGVGCCQVAVRGLVVARLRVAAARVFSNSGQKREGYVFNLLRHSSPSSSVLSTSFRAFRAGHMPPTVRPAQISVIMLNVSPCGFGVPLMPRAPLKR